MVCWHKYKLFSVAAQSTLYWSFISYTRENMTSLYILTPWVESLCEPDAGPTLVLHFKSSRPCHMPPSLRAPSKNHFLERHCFTKREYIARHSLDISQLMLHDGPIYDVVAIRTHLCPRERWFISSEALIPRSSSRELIPYLLKEEKL